VLGHDNPGQSVNKSQVNERRCRKKTELQTFACSFVKKIDQNETQYRISRGQSSITRAAAEKQQARQLGESGREREMLHRMITNKISKKIHGKVNLRSVGQT
jgi:hypothetical protein